MSSLDAHLVRIAAARHGLVTRSEALAAGATDRLIQVRLDAGRWQHAAASVYRIGGAPVTWHSRLLAACLAAGPEALASHRSAAVLWGIDGFRPGAPEIVTPRHRRSRQPGVRVHESTDLAAARPTVRAGVPVTGAARTLLDLGAVVSADRVGHAVDDARRRRLVTWTDLYGTLVVHARRGRRGVGPFRAVLDGRFGERTVPESRFERLVLVLLEDAGLPVPEPQYEVRDPLGRLVARVDLGYPAQRVAVELDGRHHLTDAGFEQDRPRQNELELLGWLVLRYTWRFFVERPERLCSEIAAALSRTCVA